MWCEVYGCCGFSVCEWFGRNLFLIILLWVVWFDLLKKSFPIITIWVK